MKKDIRFEELSKEEALLLLRAFDYDVDPEGYILTPSGSRIQSEEVPSGFIKLEEAALMPGSLNIVDGTPISISKYLRENMGGTENAGD